MRLTRLHQIAAHADDLAASRAFYQEKLGAHHVATFDPPGILFFEFGGVRLMLESGAAPATLHFRVDDIDAAFRELRERGVEFEDEPHVIHRDDDGIFDNPGTEEWMVFFRDPGGNLLALACRR